VFIGHYGAALAGKRIAPRVSLGTLFLGAQLPDLIWPILLLLGVERVRIEPGLMAMLAKLETMIPPVSVCHQLSWIGN